MRVVDGRSRREPQARAAHSWMGGSTIERSYGVRAAREIHIGIQCSGENASPSYPQKTHVSIARGRIDLCADHSVELVWPETFGDI